MRQINIPIAFFGNVLASVTVRSRDEYFYERTLTDEGEEKIHIRNKQLYENKTGERLFKSLQFNIKFAQIFPINPNLLVSNTECKVISGLESF